MARIRVDRSQIAAFGKKYENLLFFLFSFSGLNFFNFLLVRAVRPFIQIEPFDEAKYIQLALGRGPQFITWGPLYTRFIYILSVVSPTPEALYFFNYCFQGFLVVFLHLILCYRLRIGKVLALLSAVCVYYSSFNIPAAPKINVFDCSFLYLALILSSFLKERVWQLFALALFLVPAIFIRQENAFELVIVLFVLAFYVLKQSRRTLALILPPLLLASGILLVGNPFSELRAWLAFRLLYAAAATRRDLLPPLVDDIIRRAFGESHSMFGAFRFNPRAFLSYAMENERELFVQFPQRLAMFSSGLFSSARLGGGSISEMALGLGMLEILVVACLVRVGGRSGRPISVFQLTWLIFFGTLCFKTIVVTAIFSAEPRYSTELLFFTYAAVALALNAVLGELANGRMYYVALVGFLVISDSAMPVADLWARSSESHGVRGVLQVARRFELKRPMFAVTAFRVFLFNDSSPENVLNEYFYVRSRSSTSLGRFLDRRDFRTVLIDEAAENEFRTRGLSQELNLLSERPEWFGYARVKDVPGLVQIFERRSEYMLETPLISAASPAGLDDSR